MNDEYPEAEPDLEMIREARAENQMLAAEVEPCSRCSVDERGALLDYCDNCVQEFLEDQEAQVSDWLQMVRKEER